MKTSSKTIVVDGVEYEVVWSGGEGLIPDRPTRVGENWTPPRRLYNRTGKYAKKSVDNAEPKIENPIEEE